MGLAFRINSLEDLGDMLNRPLREFYVPQNEDDESSPFVLDVDGVVDASFRANNIRLMKESKKLKEELAEISKSLEATNLELEEVKGGSGKEKPAGNQEHEQEISRLREKIRTLEAEKTQIAKEYEEAGHENYRLKARTEFMPLAKKVGLKDNPRVQEMAFNDFLKVMKFKDGKFVPEDEDGDVRVDDDGTPLTVDKFWLKYREENEDWAFSPSSGSDSTPGRRTAGRRDMTLSIADLADPSKMTMEALGEIQKGKLKVE